LGRVKTTGTITSMKASLYTYWNPNRAPTRASTPTNSVEGHGTGHYEAQNGVKRTSADLPGGLSDACNIHNAPHRVHIRGPKTA
jgi:hypothetical protein